jgi:septal ring factor EnvC (AmiA/AmiB activator)
MTDKMTAEEMLTEIGLFFLKKPKGMLIMFGSVAVIIGILYFSSIKAQNSILIDSLKVLGSTAQISDTIVKKVKEIEVKAEVASKDIDERMARLDEVEKRFQAKREEIKRLREEQEIILKQVEAKLKEANIKLDKIEEQQMEQRKQQEMLIRAYEFAPNKSMRVK